MKRCIVTGAFFLILCLKSITATDNMTFFDLYKDKLCWLNAYASIHVKAHYRMKIAGPDGKWLTAPSDGICEVYADIPSLSRFVVKWSPQIQPIADEKLAIIGFSTMERTLTSDGSTLVEQSFRSYQDDPRRYPLAIIKNFNAKDEDVPILYSGLIFVWPFQITTNELWYGPLGAQDQSNNILLNNEDKDHIYFQATDANLLSKALNQAPRIQEFRKLTQNGNTPLPGTRPQLPILFDLSVKKLPGFPLQHLRISSIKNFQVQEITGTTTYDVHSYMEVDSHWIPKQATYTVSNQEGSTQVDVTVDEFNVNSKPLDDAFVKPAILSQSTVYDTRLNIRFKAGAAPESILKHFKILGDDKPEQQTQ